MRNGQNKRMRGRNNNHGHHGGHGGHNHGGHRKHHNPMARVYESNGPEVKIRGNPAHIAEKYMQLARDAQSSGDPIAAENYYQHAEHYFRLIAAAQEQFRLNNPHLARPENEVQQGARDEAYEEGEDDGQQPSIGERPLFGTGEPQPYMPPNAQPFPQYQQPQPQHQQHQPPQPSQPYQPRPQQGGETQGDVGQLPSFITGGQGQPQTTHQGNGQNGHDNQGGDRFPLHRRRRRHHRGPRPEGGGGNDGDSSQ